MKGVFLWLSVKEFAFQKFKGMTQKYLGMQMGFPEKTADIRMAQYESGSRTPKADLTNNLAEVFGISTQALTVPDIDSDLGLIHTLFTLEDLYGMSRECKRRIHLCFDENKPTASKSILQCSPLGQSKLRKYRNSEITKEQYDEWRYTYRNSIPHKLGQKYRRRNSAMQWSKHSGQTQKYVIGQNKRANRHEIC